MRLDKLIETNGSLIYVYHSYNHNDFYESRRVSIKRSSTFTSRTIFGVRMRQARERLGVPQDKLGVMIGLDEETASARISR